MVDKKLSTCIDFSCLSHLVGVPLSFSVVELYRHFRSLRYFAHRIVCHFLMPKTYQSCVITPTGQVDIWWDQVYDESRVRQIGFLPLLHLANSNGAFNRSRKVWRGGHFILRMYAAGPGQPGSSFAILLPPMKLSIV